MAEEKKSVNETVSKTASTQKVAEPKKKVTKKATAKSATKKVVSKTESKKTVKTEPKEVVKKPRVEKRAKKYRAVAEKLEKGMEYSLAEAVKIVKTTSTTKFDSSVEVHLNLNTDTKNPEHALRGSVSLPAGLGKSKKVAVVCGTDMEKDAKEAGADLIGGKELIEKIIKGETNFDVLVATPEMMPELAKAGKVLGPKGLMPNPKDNTVTTDIKGTIDDIKKGRAEYRSDSYGIIHSVVGKVSFDEEKLLENIETFLSTIHSIKPSGVRGTFIKSIYLTTTMGPSIKVKE